MISVNTVDRRSALRMLFRAIALFLSLLAPSAASANKVWEAHTGDPCCGLPDSFYKYLDANEACRKEVPLPAPSACLINQHDMRNSAGPQTLGACVFNQTCICDFCSGPGSDDGVSFGGKFTGFKTQACPDGTTEHLGLCVQDSPKGKGPCVDCENLARANPVNIGSGNKYQSETVYRAASGQLELVLFYNSQAGTSYFESMAFGAHWSVRYLAAVRDSGQGIVAVHRPDGRDLQFRAPASGNPYLGDADIAGRLEKLTDGPGNLIGWRYTASEGDEVEEFDAAGKLLLIRNRAGLQQAMTYSSAGTPASIAPAAGLLLAVTDSFGRQLGFTYNAQRRVNSMTDPAGGQYLFEYDGSGGPAASGNRTRLPSPDTKTRVYFYKEAAQINGGAACSSPSPVLNNALTGLSDENDSRYATWTYDCQVRVTSSVHALGVGLYSFNYGTGTSTAYLDSLGTSRSAGLQRTLGVARGTGTTQPAANGSGTVSTSATYDANGNIASRTDWNGNQTIYAFDPARNLEISRTEANGTPQQRTTSTDWHPTFRLPTQIVEPLRTTTSVYDAHGQPLTIVDPNGMTITLGYDARQRLTSRNSGGEITTYDYDGVGQLTKVTLPDLSYLSYSYDPAHRLTGMQDKLGNSISYGLDAMGNRTLEEVFDPANVRVQKRTRDYDSLNRLFHEFGAQNQPTEYGYDNQGNVKAVKDPLNHVTSNDYDALNRLWRVTDAGVGVTQYGYNSLDALTQVTDPRNLVTGYSVNGLGNLTQQSSPDTGSTVNTYDAAGNLLTQTDP